MQGFKPTTISRAAKAAGVGVETIRFYERKGLIEQPQQRNASGYRLYTQATVERIRTIQQAQKLGFTLREIRELLSLNDRLDGHCEEVYARAGAKLSEVQDKIRNLQRIEQALELLMQACPRQGRLDRCPILTALGGGTFAVQAAQS